MVREAEKYLQQGRCECKCVVWNLDMSVVYSQSFVIVERTEVLGLTSCHRRKVILSTIHALDLYRVG